MSKTILDELVQADPAAKMVTDEQLGTLGVAVNKMLNFQIQIHEQEILLKATKAQEREYNQGVIPQLMSNLGFESITVDGKKIAVKDSIQISIPAPQRPAAYKWLDDNEHGSLIKTVLTAKFGRGDSDAAEEAQEALDKLGVSNDLVESVHAGTLKAWARVELEQGHSLPSDKFKVHVVKITTVK
ncbi:MAG: hypothetical protein V3R57_07735 [Candidatus Bathyarchaeia archaeon]